MVDQHMIGRRASIYSCVPTQGPGKDRYREGNDCGKYREYPRGAREEVGQHEAAS